MKSLKRLSVLAVAVFSLFSCGQNNEAESPAEQSQAVLSSGGHGTTSQAVSSEQTQDQRTAGQKIADYIRAHDDAKETVSVDEYDDSIKLTASYSVSGEVFTVRTNNTGSHYSTQLSWTIGDKSTASNVVTIVVGDNSYQAHLKLSFLASGTIDFKGETEETFDEGSPVNADRLNRAFNQLKFGVDGARSAIFSPLDIRPW